MGRGRVYDCFPFFNEFEMLELRLNTLNDVVDFFVITELNFTHQGQPKPFYFEENKSRFERFLPKIKHVKHNYDHWQDNGWVREHWQRDIALYALDDFKENDIIMVSDVDEIPRPSIVANFQLTDKCKVVQHRLYNYYLNCYAGLQENNSGVGLRIASGEFFNQIPTLIDVICVGNWRPSCTHLRYLSLAESDMLPDAGWHFSWQGGYEKVVEKLESFAHIELNRPELKEKKLFESVDRSEEPFVYGIRHDKLKYKFVEIDNSFPRYIVENKTRFEVMGWIKKINWNHALGF